VVLRADVSTSVGIPPTSTSSAGTRAGPAAAAAPPLDNRLRLEGDSILLQWKLNFKLTVL
jgi:hypothetical protein